MYAPVIDSARLRSFLERATSDECVEFAALQTSGDRDRIRFLLDTYAGEVPIVLSLLAGVEIEGRRLLDVGAGIGLTSFFLASSGYDVTALEPGGLGFDLNQGLFIALRKYFDLSSVMLLSIGAEELDANKHGAFDVVFSANVLEHVVDLQSVIRAMAGVLSSRGLMIHTCPNYTVPYEPHYGLPLLPFKPAMTPWAGDRRREDVWIGLNFITVRQLERLLRDAGTSPEFEKGLMAKSIERLLTDPVFASRHPTLSRVAYLMRLTGVLRVLKSLPARYGTPLVVRASKSGVQQPA